MGREHSVWRWCGAVLLLALALLLVSSLPTTALATFFDHPDHPLRRSAEGTAVGEAGARWLRIASVCTAIVWVAGALVLSRWRSDQDRAPHQPVPSRELFVVSAIVLSGALLRAPFLFHSLWFDEIAAIGDFTRYGPGPILGAWFTPSNHVLQSLLTWVSATLFGTSEFTLRLPAFLAGLGTIVAVHALGRRAGGPSIGIVAALITALMPVAVVEATEARGYALSICFTAIACWAFVRGMQSGEPWTWIVMAFAGAMATWSHFVASLAIVGLALVAVAMFLTRGTRIALVTRDMSIMAATPPLDRNRRGRAASALVGAVMSGALATTLLAPLAPDVIAMRSQFGQSQGATPTLLSAEGARIAFMLGGTWAAAIPPALAVLPGAALFLAGLAASRSDGRVRLAILASLAGLPLLVLLALAGSWTYARFGSFVVPGVALTMAVGLSALVQWQRRVGIIVGAAFAASSLVELAMLPERQPIRTAVEQAAVEARAGDVLVDLGIRGSVSAFYAPPQLTVLSAGVSGARLDALLADPRVRWVVVTYAEVLPRERFAELAARGFERAETWPGWIDWGRGGVELWRRRSNTPPSRQ